MSTGAAEVAWRCAAAGAVLGIASRVEESTRGFSAGISSERTWVLFAVVLGALAAGPSRGRRIGPPAAGGAIALTAANAAWYAWIALTEPGVDLMHVAGSPLRWLVLGVTVGAGAGAAGALARWVARRRARPTPG